MVLVTGANGFIGRALVSRLTNEGWAVKAAVRRPSGFPSESLVGDLGARTDWGNALQGCRAVVHLAARVHVMRDTARDPLIEFRAINVDGTLNLARQAARTGIKRFVFLSSIKVNGEQASAAQPFTVDAPPAPEDAYGLSKLEAESGLREICVDSGMEFVVIRPPLVYGPGVGGNLKALMRWVPRGIPLPLGAVNNRRSLIALDNLTDLIATCLVHPAAANQIFLAADGEDVSTTELLRRIAYAWGQTPRLLPVPTSWLARCAAMLGKTSIADRLLGSLVVDSSRTREALGWYPVVSMEEQLRRMAEDDPRF